MGVCCRSAIAKKAAQFKWLLQRQTSNPSSSRGDASFNMHIKGMNTLIAHHKHHCLQNSFLFHTVISKTVARKCTSWDNNSDFFKQFHVTTLACFPDRCSVVPAHPCSLPAIRLGDVCWEGARCGRLRSGTPSPLAAASLLPAAAWAPSLSPQGGSEPFNATRGNTVGRTEISSVHLGLMSAEGYGEICSK